MGIVFSFQKLYDNFLTRLPHSFLTHIGLSYNEFIKWLNFIIWYKTLSYDELRVSEVNELQ